MYRNNRRRQTGLKTNFNPKGKHLGIFKSNLLSYKIPSNYAKSLCKENVRFIHSLVMRLFNQDRSPISFAIILTYTSFNSPSLQLPKLRLDLLPFPFRLITLSNKRIGL